MRRLCILAIPAMLFGCSSPVQEPERHSVAWQLDFEHPIRFQQVVDEQLLVVGTSRHLYGLDPRSGALRWRERNISARTEDVLTPPDSDYLLVLDAAGGSFDDRDTHVLAIAREDGHALWESPRIRGKLLQGVIDAERGRFYAVAVESPHGDDSGMLGNLLPGKGIGAGFAREPRLLALDLASGRLLWERAFGREVAMRPTAGLRLDEQGDWQSTRAFDLGLYHPPFDADGMVCLSYEGLDCFDGVSGERRWSNRFDSNDGDLALSYASPAQDRNTIYLSGEGRVRAIDKMSGRTLWRSRKSDVLPEILDGGDTLYVQLGGRFFDIGKERWSWQGEFGVMAIDRSSGKRIWEYDGGNDAITNLLVIAGRVCLADEDKLIVLDQSSGKRLGSIEHRFEEPPVYSALNDAGQLLLINESEVAAFDARSLERLWYVRHEPPGPGAWSRFSGGLLGLSGSVLKLGSTIVAYSSGLVPSIPVVPVPATGAGIKLISTKRIVRDATGRTGRRLGYRADAMTRGGGMAQLSGEYQYFVTTAGRDDRPALAAVALDTGETARMIELPHEEPSLLIDDATGSLYQIDGRRLTAMRLR